MKIPKSFNLFGRTVNVVYEDELCMKDDMTGAARYNRNDIILQNNVKGFKRSKTDIEQVFFHELVHWIFKELGEHTLRDNEKLVDTFASLLHQALTSAKY